MLNPAQDAINLINEFGTSATLRSTIRDFDAQTGEPIDSFTSKQILVLPFSVTKQEMIQNPMAWTKEPVNFTIKYEDGAKINDEIVIEGKTWVLKAVTDEPSFSHIPSGINNSAPFTTFRGEVKQDSA